MIHNSVVSVVIEFFSFETKRYYFYVLTHAGSQADSQFQLKKSAYASTILTQRLMIRPYYEK